MSLLTFHALARQCSGRRNILTVFLVIIPGRDYLQGELFGKRE
jgi:hypothetical protein